ncbi:MAG TPA: hypothetical protein VFL92_13470 [Sphingomonas sp.]|nr:hypothetical protein [Sphingomonas sp.]
MEEYPIAKIPDTAHWSENFAYACFDAQTNIGLFCHIGRWRRDPNLWREVVTVALPDRTVLVHRAIGNALATQSGPGGSNLAIGISEPGPRFALRFLGGVRRIEENALTDEPLLRDGPHYRLELAIDYAGITPVWDISAAGHTTEFMGAGHVEQFGRFTGTITIDDERYILDTIGNRDHSRGPRVLNSNKRHSWLHGKLDDGRLFQLYEAEVHGREGPAYAEANVVIDGKAHKAEAVIHDKLPMTDNLHLIREPVRITLDYAGGEIDVTAIDFPHTTTMQSTSPNDMYVGRRQESGAQNTMVIEQSVLFRTSQGGAGYGHMERLVPGVLLADPA